LDSNEQEKNITSFHNWRDTCPKPLFSKEQFFDFNLFWTAVTKNDTMKKQIKGRVWVLGDDVDTDVIYPGKYLPILDPEEMAKHALEGEAADFPECIKPGDIIVAGMGFGCGSSREQAATCLKAAGIAAVVAGSFARIFFRNAVNQGLPLVQANLKDEMKDGDELTIDFENNTVSYSRGKTNFPPLAESVQDILNAGGLIPAVRKKLGIEN
jgi:3-isopropylmalate/(R)-2-methylmalate dehydratase small subunit